MSLSKHLTEAEIADLIPPRTILLGYRGSISHGMYLNPDDPNSVDDKDLMGVCIPPDEAWFGPRRFEQRERKVREWDSVVYEFRKFISLLEKSNPNVLSLLWLNPEHYIIRSEAGDTLIRNRQLFATKMVYQAFTGYAYGQLKRMTHYAKEGYMGEKRKALVDKYGFDVKNAACLIRLLKMGIEFLVDGELRVFREDAPRLMEIKRGEWTLEQVKAEADRLFILAEEANVRSALPLRPDAEKVNQLCVKIMTAFWKDHLAGVV